MKKGDIFILLFRIPIDFCGIIAAWFLAYFLRPYTDLIPGVHYDFALEMLPGMSFFVPFVLATALLFVLLLTFLGYYRFYENYEPVREFFRGLFAVFLWGMLIVAWYALFRHELIFSRVMLLQAMAFSLLFSWLGRLILRIIQVIAWNMGKNHKRVILFGKPESTAVMKKEIEKTPQFDVVGEFSESDLSALEESKIKADELWRCDPQSSKRTAQRLDGLCNERHLFFRYVPQDESLSYARLEFSFIGETPVVLAIPSAPTAWGRVGKRAFDIFGSLFLILFLSPLLFLLSLLIKKNSEGPVFYRSVRVGQYGKTFVMWKFRSMVYNAEKQKRKLEPLSHRDGPLFKIKDDPRITGFGKFLRKTSFDELPNLYNVLRGEMSLVGPRPHLQNEIMDYETWQKRVLMMKPGITGLAQVSGRSDLPFAEEMQLDHYYLENWSFWLDIKILMKTVFIVTSQKGAD